MKASEETETAMKTRILNNSIAVLFFAAWAAKWLTSLACFTTYIFLGLFTLTGLWILAVFVNRPSDGDLVPSDSNRFSGLFLKDEKSHIVLTAGDACRSGAWIIGLTNAVGFVNPTLWMICFALGLVIAACYMGAIVFGLKGQSPYAFGLGLMVYMLFSMNYSLARRHIGVPDPHHFLAATETYQGIWDGQIRYPDGHVEDVIVKVRVIPSHESEVIGSDRYGNDKYTDWDEYHAFLEEVWSPGKGKIRISKDEEGINLESEEPLVVTDLDSSQELLVSIRHCDYCSYKKWVSE